MTQADRYVRTGPAVPEIYPGTQLGLKAGTRDAQQASSREPGFHSLEAVYGKRRELLYRFEFGAPAWFSDSDVSGDTWENG